MLQVVSDAFSDGFWFDSLSQVILLSAIVIFQEILFCPSITSFEQGSYFIDQILAD